MKSVHAELLTMLMNPLEAPTCPPLKASNLPDLPMNDYNFYEVMLIGMANEPAVKIKVKLLSHDSFEPKVELVFTFRGMGLKIIFEDKMSFFLMSVV